MIRSILCNLCLTVVVLTPPAVWIAACYRSTPLVMGALLLGVLAAASYICIASKGVS